MKKSTKSTKPAAPQAKSSEPKIVEPKPAKKTAAPRKKSASAASAPVAVLEETPVVSAVPAVSPIESVSVAQTTISAVIDVGFGNALFIRGEGPGLSWEKGRPLECVADDRWSITVGELSKPISFKFLLNDQTWCAGTDYVVEPGRSVTLEPVF